VPSEIGATLKAEAGRAPKPASVVRSARNPMDFFELFIVISFHGAVCPRLLTFVFELMVLSTHSANFRAQLGQEFGLSIWDRIHESN
jgi:hypothetical protein